MTPRALPRCLWPSWGAALCWGLVALAGCTPADRRLRWEISFDDPTVAARTTAVEGRILLGGCGSANVVFADEVGRDEAPAMPDRLGGGRYGFEARAQDDTCTVIASGCVDMELPAAEGAVVSVLLRAGSGPARCAATCNAGRCEMPLDAGTADAGLDTSGSDVPMMDVPALDVPGLDAPMLDVPSTDVPTDTPRDTPTDVPGDAGPPRAVASIAVGTAFVCARTTDGALFCWGANFSGQLGQGTSGTGTERRTPTRVGADSTWSAIAVGDEHVCGLRGSALVCWGNNMDGQLGTGDMTNRTMPTVVSGITGPFDAIDGARLGDHTCTRTAAGTIACIGQNDYGQLGLGDNVNHLTYGAWTGTYRSLSTGHHFTCAVSTGGVLTCTGRNNVAQLGSGTTGTNVNVPTTIGAGTDWTMVGAGEQHTCGLRGLGELWCWGDGTNAATGLGGTALAPTPMRVGTGTNWTTVAGGGTFSCGLRGTGELWCWGANDRAQCGFDSGGVAVTTPMRVGTASDWVAIGLGDTFGCGLRAGGALYCWGDNASGQLATGDTTPRSSPTAVTIR